MNKNKENLKCYHCGLPCQQDSVVFDEKSFCCKGCQTVFQILSEKNMTDYYNLNTAPGASLKESHTQDTAYLDNREIQEQLLNFMSEELHMITVTIPDIHCSSCVWLLENLSELNPGILKTQVNYLKKTLAIRFYSKKTSLRQVVDLLYQLGYPPSLQDSANTKSNPSLSLKLGVAGFCFGNIMLLSFPEYLNVDQDFRNSYQSFFHLLIFILSLPVLFYCASDYFKSAWTSLRNQNLNMNVPISIGITALYSYSLYEMGLHSRAGYIDSFAGFVFFLLIGKAFQEKTFEHLNFKKNPESYFPLAANKIINDTVAPTLLKDLKVGDRIHIKNQDVIPADSKIISGLGIIDYSFVTGESLENTVNPGEKLYAGGRQNGASLEVEICKEPQESYLIDLWQQTRSEISSSHKSHLELSKLTARYFTIGLLFIAFLGTSFWLWHQPELAMRVFVSTLIIACPCALALAAPFTLGTATRLLGKSGLFLRDSQTLETLANTDLIAFDKTGTLTKSQDLSCTFIPHSSQKPLTDEEASWILSSASHSHHPLSQIIYKTLIETTTLKVPIESFEEKPGLGIIAKTQNHKVCIGSGKLIKTKIQEQGSDFFSDIYLEIDDELRGRFQIKTQTRSDITDLISHLKNDYLIHIITGDRHSLENSSLPETQTHTEMSPLLKTKIITSWQKQGNCVTMIGDGINDFGALEQSDCGIAVSESLNRFTPSSDAILEIEKIKELPQIFAFSKSCLKIIKTNYALSLAYNVIGLSFALTAQLSPLVSAVLMPLSSLSVMVLSSTLTTYSFDKKLGKKPDKNHNLTRGLRLGNSV